jgi:large subunit ribosomal protein L18
MNEKKQSRLRRAKSTRLHIRALGATRLCVNRTPRHIINCAIKNLISLNKI